LAQAGGGEFWLPESVAVGPDEIFSWSFADKAATCSVRPDHLQPLAALAAAVWTSTEFALG